MRALICFTVALSIVCFAHGFGKDLIHSAGAQEPLPTTTNAASAAGWVRSNSPCIPSIGQAWNKKHPYPTTSHPMTLYFAANGQISGFGTDLFGDVPDLWYLRGYYVYIDEGQYRIKVATRSADTNMCTVKTAFSEPIGDRIIIHPDGINHRIPPNEDDAAAKKWSRGACLDGMGRHWEYDLVSAPAIVRNILYLIVLFLYLCLYFYLLQSYNVSTLLPVVPMYDLNGNLNVIFFASSSVQQGLFSNNQWGK